MKISNEMRKQFDKYNRLLALIVCRSQHFDLRARYEPEKQKAAKELHDMKMVELWTEAKDIYCENKEIFDYMHANEEHSHHCGTYRMARKVIEEEVESIILEDTDD